MSREWKPGDVAITQFGRSVVDSGKRCSHDYAATPHWHHVTHGGWDPLGSHPTARPLVVIDPEDREAVERLATSLGSGSHLLWGVEYVQERLREFANPKPPKPDEPTGLGAVVEDEEGRRYTRYDSSDVQPWWWDGKGSEAPVVRRYHWDDISAVRVLSPGVEVDQ